MSYECILPFFVFHVVVYMMHVQRGKLLSWSYGSWIFNYLCNQYLLLLTLWVRIPLMARCTRCNYMW